jgi:recombination protein RecA
MKLVAVRGENNCSFLVLLALLLLSPNTVVSIDTRRKEILPDNTGIRVKVKVVKNKVATPFKAVMLDILFGSGIDRMGCTLDAALELGVVERRGSWYAYKGDNLAQGRLKAVELLKEKPDLAQQLEADVRVALAEAALPAGSSTTTDDLPDIADLEVPVHTGMIDDTVEAFME